MLKILTQNPGWYASEIMIKLRAKRRKIRRDESNDKDSIDKHNHTRAFRVKHSTIFKGRLATRIRGNLKQVGFDVIFKDSIGFGPFHGEPVLETLYKNIGTIDAALDREKKRSYYKQFGNDLIFLSRKKEVPADISKRSIFEDISESKKRFETEYSEYFERSTRWIERYPAYRTAKPEQFDLVVGNRERILVVSPHPDDEIIGCGGTLIKMLDQGRQVTVVHLLDGSKTFTLDDANEEIRHTARLKEAADVSNYIGFSDLVLWKIPDSELCVSKVTIERMCDLLERVNPQIIFTPFINDPHPDHRAANELLSSALTELKSKFTDTIFIGYECWSLLPIGTISTINSEFDKKIRALMKYKIAMRWVDYVQFCEKLNAYRHYTSLGKAGYAEAFFSTDRDTFIKLQKDQQRNLN